MRSRLWALLLLGVVVVGSDLIVGQPSKETFERYDTTLRDLVAGRVTPQEHELARKAFIDSLKQQFNTVETFMGTRGVTVDIDGRLDLPVIESIRNEITEVTTSVVPAGSGLEYIFSKYSAGVLPENRYPSNGWAFDNPGTVNGQVWSDGAPALDAANSFLFMSQRRIRGATVVAGQWSVPVVVAILDTDGVPGADGSDPMGYEYIFTAHSSDLLPANQFPLDSWVFDMPGTVNGKTWTDGAPTLTVDSPFLFRSERSVKAGPPVFDWWDYAAGDWSDTFQTSTVFREYSKTGSDRTGRVGFENPGATGYEVTVQWEVGSASRVTVIVEGDPQDVIASTAAARFLYNDWRGALDIEYVSDSKDTAPLVIPVFADLGLSFFGVFEQ